MAHVRLRHASAGILALGVVACASAPPPPRPVAPPAAAAQDGPPPALVAECEQAGFQVAIVRTPRAPETSERVAAEAANQCVQERWTSKRRDCVYSARTVEHLDECRAGGPMTPGAARRLALADRDCDRFGGSWVFALQPPPSSTHKEAVTRLWATACKERTIAPRHIHCVLAALGDEQHQACVDRVPSALRARIVASKPTAVECQRAASNLVERSVQSWPKKQFAANIASACSSSWTRIEAYCVETQRFGISRNCGANVGASLDAEAGRWKRGSEASTSSGLGKTRQASAAE